MAIDLQNLIDIDLLAYFKSKLDLLFANKVDKETGKGLSTNDYTAAEKAKLANIAAGAQVNVLEGVQANGTTVVPVNKIANITIPTNTSDLTNDSGFITSADVPDGATASTSTPLMDGTAAVGTSTAFARGDHVHPSDSSKANAADVYTKTEIDQKLAGALSYKGTKATTLELPVSGNTQGDVWHVTADGSEWAWNGTQWEELGTAIDLSGYVEESEISLATNAQIDAIFE